jgi:hypothetical protein
MPPENHLRRDYRSFEQEHVLDLISNSCEMGRQVKIAIALTMDQNYSPLRHMFIDTM